MFDHWLKIFSVGYSKYLILLALRQIDVSGEVSGIARVTTGKPWVSRTV